MINPKIKTVPTQFRLTEKECYFLELLGFGNKALGLRVALYKCGLLCESEELRLKLKRMVKVLNLEKK